MDLRVGVVVPCAQLSSHLHSELVALCSRANELLGLSTTRNSLSVLNRTLDVYPEQVIKVYQSGPYVPVPMRREKRRRDREVASYFHEGIPSGSAQRVNVCPRVITHQVWVREVVPTQFSWNFFSSRTTEMTRSTINMTR